MEGIRKDLNKKQGSPLTIVFFFYLTSLEFFLSFLFYIGFYIKFKWWIHPTIGGSFILIGLFLITMIFGFLGQYYLSHLQKAAFLSNRMMIRNSHILFLSLILLILITLAVIILKSFIIQYTYFQIFHKYPVLSCLAALLFLKTIGTLFSLKGTYFEEALRNLLLNLINLKTKIGAIKISTKDLTKVLQKNWFHILVWIVMIFYLAIGPALYARFVVMRGKPVEFSQGLPVTTDQIKFWVDALDSISSNDQGLYILWGWSFYLEDPNQAMYDRFIVLRSNVKTYFFPTHSVQRPGVQQTFKDLNMDLLNTGFSALISKLTIQPGKYRIGILFKHQSSNTLQYISTNNILTRTPNQLILETHNQQ